MCQNRMLKTKNYKRKTEQGVSLYMVFMIMTLLLGIGFGMSALLLSQLDTLRGIGYSVLAFYATDAGIDRALYIDQKECSGASGRLSCLQGKVPSGSQPLDNGATYTIEIESPGVGACPTAIFSKPITYCAKSVGTYKQARRAVRVAR